MKNSRWLELFREHPEKHLFSVSDLAQLTGQKMDVLRVELTRLVKAGTIERAASGWYCNPFSMPTPEEVAMVLRRPSYISMEYALSIHSILSQTAYSITLVTRKGPYTYRRGPWVIEYHQISKKLFWGFEERDGVLVAEPEKALLDLIYIRHVRNREFDTEGLKSLMNDMYLEDMDRDKLKKYADRFGGRTLETAKMLLMIG